MRHQHNDILPRQIKNFGLEIANPYPSRRLITTARDYQKLRFLVNSIAEQSSYSKAYKSVMSSNLLFNLDIGANKNHDSSEKKWNWKKGDSDVQTQIPEREPIRRYHFFESEFNTAFWIDTKTNFGCIYDAIISVSRVTARWLASTVKQFTDRN